MVHFFNRLRLGLIKTGAAKKYVLYAIGEILLVMIGILLALQVNNWNEEKKERATEKEFLLALEAEFNTNVKEFENIYEHHTLKEKAQLRLLRIIDDQEIISHADSLSQLIFNASFTNTYNPRFGITHSLINSSNLNIIQNKELKFGLSKLPGLLNDYMEEEEIELRVNFDILYPILLKYNSEEMFDLLSDTEFINIIKTKNSSGILNEGKALKKELSQLQSIIKSEITK